MGETFDIDIDATDPKSPEGKDVCEQCDTLLSVPESESHLVPTRY